MIVALPPHGLSAAAAARNPHWIKKLTGVNVRLVVGHVFEGESVQFGDTVDVPEGTFFLSYIEDRRGSGRLDGRTVTLYQASNDAVQVVKGWDLDGSAGWALRIRDEVATMLGAALSTDSIIWMIDEPSLEIADQLGYASRWDRFDAAGKSHHQPGGEIPDAAEPHHSDQCAGSPEFILGPDERWSARCARGTLCDGVGDNRMWEVTGCETLREAGARFFGGDDRRLYGDS